MGGRGRPARRLASVLLVAPAWGSLAHEGEAALLTLGLLSQPLRCWREARTALLV